MSLQRYCKSALIGVAAACSISVTANAGEARYFKSVEGNWSGPGSIVAGKYKGTKFFCNFKGSSINRRTGMDISGTCRVGVFTQKMSAKVYRSGRSYRGQFLDGAKGKGLDIVSGRLSGKRLIVGINRKQLKGAMVANLKNNNRLNLTISVRVSGELIPVIGITLDRKNARARKTAFND
ncbi:MAG: hypothetical protein AAF468_08480 [Pseudomonadota bacterium]